MIKFGKLHNIHVSRIIIVRKIINNSPERVISKALKALVFYITLV